ncbi:MAG: insulinase family protein [Desulfovibrio sp.]|jgi:Zn-dependent M16 (insulinase) family peptidase|nr:insulinase family protein [Desulfovibrio sp.]
MHGFILLREEEVAELSSLARIWRHEDSGARLLSFRNADENKVFGVTFRTPSGDSTGVAHILEHSVLCGSEKYPVKEPFVELLKGSLHTFLNAFTYPDKTCYPVASANLQDFYNLIDVYLDAVFFPRISEEIFAQEGWHLELSPSGPLFKGVVYNEMKGVFSSPDSLLERQSLRALFPDTVYAGESGGDPADIPSLSYAAFCAFHARHYHPENARFFFWGDDPEEERLARLSTVLGRFARREGVSVAGADTGAFLSSVPAIAVQEPFKEPRRLVAPFAVSGDFGEGEKGMVTLNWLGPEVTDIKAALSFRILEHALLGLPASPLRRALIESGLGEDIAGQGLESELRQLFFAVGLKGVSPACAGRVEELTLSVLEGLRSGGIGEEILEAALNSVEFSLRENNSGRFPVGLSVMLRALTTWLHEGDPLAPLRFEKHLRDIRDDLTQAPGYFEDFTGRWLLDNPHRVTIVLEPDGSLQDKLEREEKERADVLAGSLSEDGRERAAELAESLLRMQEESDAPEALALIPRLRLSDLPPVNRPIPTEMPHVPGATVFFHPLPTRGIVYAQAALDLAGVPDRLLPLLPLFCRALLEMGTARRDFAELNMLVARKTGGLEADSLFLTRAGQDSRLPVARLVLSGKAAPDKAEDLFEIMGEVLAEARFADPERFLRMALEEKARMEHGLVPSGHAVVASRLRSALSSAARLSECAEGVSALPYLRELAGKLPDAWEEIGEDLENLRACVLHRAGISFNLTALPEQGGLLEELASGLAGRLPAGLVAASGLSGRGRAAPSAEALILPAQVNYVGKAVNLLDAGYACRGQSQVIVRHLRAGYLWDRVRVRGGAYGCFCTLDRLSGALVMVSYRDPNILPTLDVFDGAAAYLSRNKPDRAELEKAVIGAIGELDAYLLPDAGGEAAFVRTLCNDTEERRQKLREEILSTRPDDFAEFAEALADFAGRGLVCALGGASLERLASEKDWVVEKVL